MCWITFNKSHAKPLVAEEDIPVQKVLTRRGARYASSLFHHFEWTFNLIYECTMGDLCFSVISVPAWTIQQGFHSCRKIEDRKYYFVAKASGLVIVDNSNFDRVIVNCIIPKGATYYVNEWDEYVSNQLKLVS